ncbi:MAG: hypothetical protein U5J97_01740 [Trueperaceae bacterium]|nr:hypothetical protein [Trueperaceae bacterium]
MNVELVAQQVVGLSHQHVQAGCDVALDDQVRFERAAVLVQQPGVQVMHVADAVHLGEAGRDALHVQVAWRAVHQHTHRLGQHDRDLPGDVPDDREGQHRVDPAPAQREDRDAARHHRQTG